MSDDLEFHGNELVQFQTIFVVGNVLGLLPCSYLFPRLPMHILVPTMDLAWGLFTLAQYRAQSYGQIMAYRFLVAICEVTISRLKSAPYVSSEMLSGAPRHPTFPAYISCSGLGIETTSSADEAEHST